jgi:hypothetical protein
MEAWNKNKISILLSTVLCLPSHRQQPQAVWLLPLFFLRVSALYATGRDLPKIAGIRVGTGENSNQCSGFVTIFYGSESGKPINDDPA